jgi:hypothetical protein
VSAPDAFGFDRVARIANAGRVDERQREAIDVDPLRHEVSRGPRDLGDDRPGGAGKRVEQARFAGIGSPDDDDGAAFAHHAAGASVCGEALDLLADPRQLRQCFWMRDKVKSFLRKVQRGFQSRAEVEQRRVDPADRGGERAFELIHRRARLKRRDGLHQVGDRFGLREIQPAVQVRTKRELAGLGEAGAGCDRRIDNGGE